MTFKEKLRQERPENISTFYVAECYGCPHHYGYESKEESNKNCNAKEGKGCGYCCNREMEEDMKKGFTKSDLKEGMVVEYANGKRRIFLNESLIGNGSGNFIEYYNDNLKNRTYEEHNIEKVYKVKQGLLKIERLFDDDYLELIWERKETKTMTAEEMAKKLEELTGEKVKIEPSWAEMYVAIQIHCENHACGDCCLNTAACNFDYQSTKEELRPYYNKIMQSKTESE